MLTITGLSLPVEANSTDENMELNDREISILTEAYEKLESIGRDDE